MSEELGSDDLSRGVSVEGPERVEDLLETAQDRLANGCDKEIYNRALRDASAWWLTATEKERAEKREKVLKRERWLRSLFLKPPQIGWYNDFLHKKVERYEGWSEVFKSVEAEDFNCS